MCFDLIKKPLLTSELLVISGVASVWPLPLARRPEFKDQIGRLPEMKELEKHALSITMETAVMTMVREKAPDLKKSVSPITVSIMFSHMT